MRHSRGHTALWIVGLSAALGLAIGVNHAAIVVGPGPSAPLEQRAAWLETRLMAPCCRANPISDHYSAAADRMRQELREMLRDGRSEAQILEVFVERHGEQILAMPRAEGFGRVAYLAPVLLMLVGALSVSVAVTRWRRASGPDRDPDPHPAVSDVDAERLRRELQEHG